MTKKLKKELRLKDGSFYAKGVSASIKVLEDKPTIAILTIGYRDIKIKSISLHKYFNGFIDPPAVFEDPDFDSCIVPSLTGEDVEPDGWDEEGFPSVLLALGYM